MFVSLCMSVSVCVCVSASTLPHIADITMETRAFHYFASLDDIVALCLWLFKWKIAALVASKRDSILGGFVK